MENSAKNDWGKGRLVPVALLFLGLVCASWLSISSEKEMKAVHDVLAQDTSRENGLVVIKKGRGHNGWVVQEPVPAVEPTPEIEFVPEVPGVEEMDFDMDMDMSFEFPIPGIPAVPFEFEEFPAWDSVREFEFFGPDSIPAYTFRLREPVDWSEFEKEFTEKFKSQYKEFYEKNKDQIRKMIEESKHDEASRREAAEVVDLSDMHNQAELALLMSNDIMQVQKQQQRAIMNDQLRQQNLILEDMARKTDEYQKALTDMLADDGYIKRGDDLDGIHISDMDGEMIINGKKIKEKDQLKYRALHDTYFQTPKPLRPYDTHRRSE